MAKSKAKTKSTNKFFDKRMLKNIGIIVSVSINVTVIIILSITWFDWHSGKVTDLTGGLEQSTCSNLYSKEEKTLKQGTTKQVGNVKFVSVSLTNSEINSPCQVFSQFLSLAQLSQVNNSSATQYYDNLVNFHSPNNTPSTTVTVWYDGSSNKPTVYPL